MTTTLTTTATPSIAAADASAPKVLYVLKRFPQLSQTFVIREILELEAIGVTVGIDALGPVADGPQHSDVDAVRAEVRYVTRKPKLGDNEVWPIHLRLAARRPLRWARAAIAARRHGDWRRFVQAGLVAERVRREGFGHIHAHFASAASEVSRDAAALAGVSFSVTAHAKDIFHESHVAHLARRLDGAAAVVTVSDYNVRHLNQTLPQLPVVHIANGVPVAEPTAPVAGGPVLCVARLVDKKGIDTLIIAVASLRERCPGLLLEILGTGEELANLQQLTDDLKCNDRVRFLGAQPFDQVDAAYRRCSMVALPCRIGADGDRDGLPTVIVEALGRGIPVISTSIIGIPEVVQHERTGLLVEQDDSAALTDAIARLWHNPALAAELGAAGAKLVGNEFNPRRSAIKLSNVFQIASQR